MSAKKIIIDWNKVGKLLNAQCSGVSIASILGIHENTLYDRCRLDLNMEFMVFSAKKKSEGLELLKAKQFENAMTGNTTMQIWLGKQLLGQRDQIEQTITVPQVHITPLTEKEQIEISTAMIAIENHESNTDLHPEPEGGSSE